MQPIKPITVVGRKVDRKVGKDLLAGYASFYATTEVMTKAMDYEVFVRTMGDVMNDHMGGDIAKTTQCIQRKPKPSSTPHRLMQQCSTSWVGHWQYALELA
jgi:hypothetical protein